MPMIGRRIYPGMKRAAWGFMQSGDFPVPVLHLKFGEGSGNALKDSSPEGNDGVNYGATWAKGYLGPGLSFDKLDDYVLVADDPSLDPTDELTIIASIYPLTTGQGGGGRVVSRFSNVNVYTSSAVASKCELHVQVAGYTNPRSGLAVNLNAWNRIGVVFTSNNHAKFYFGGVFESEGDTSSGKILEDTALDKRIGGQYAVERAFDGIIDEVLVYDEALTAAQMRQDAQGYR